MSTPADSVPHSFAQQLRQARLKLGFSQSETAQALSPRYLPCPARPLHCLVGGEESAEYLRQSRDMAMAWGGRFEASPGADHFTVIAPLADPDSGLSRTAEQLARG